MDWLNIAPALTLIGVLITVGVSIWNSRNIDKYNRVTSLVIETFKSRNDLRMACIDRRLQAHQEAFSLWSELTKSSADEFDELHTKCSMWWDRNCLYLDTNVRSEFLSYITTMKQHQQDESRVLSFEDIEKLPTAIYAASHLPPLTQSELELVKKQ